jgi:parallel beta-helix repeat protein
MRSVRNFLLALVVAAPLFGQGVDVRVEISADPREARLNASYGVHVKWDAAGQPENVVLTVEAPAPIVDLYLWDSEMTCTTEGTRIRCTLPSRSGFDGGFYLVTRPERPGTYTATAAVTSTTPDPDLSNNTSASSIEVTGLPRLRPGGISVDMERENAASPGQPGEIRAGVQNDGEPATDVVLRITLPEGGSLVGVDYYLGPDVQCDTTPAEAVCRWSRLEPFESMQFLIHYLAPDRDDGGTFPVRFEVDAAEPDSEPEGRTETMQVALRRRFVVSSTANEGSGSLRQAILDSQTLCASTPCLLSIRTTEPIRPASPLPELAGFIKMESIGTRAELDGSLLPDGPGLTGTTCELRISNFGIRNFPGHGIEARHGGECNYLRGGLFVRNNELTGNLRGLVIKGHDGIVEDNVIRFNRRAGIYIDGSFDMKVIGNEIVGNGASGVFVNLSPTGQYYGKPPEARIHDNVIHHNGEWGVSRTANGWVELKGNSIAHNFLYAYDVGLDLSTPNRDDDRVGVPNKPVLFSAAYDPVNDRTILRGSSDAIASRLDIYASTSLSGGGYPDAEQQVATQELRELGAFEVALPGDLRGKWLTATMTRTVQMDWTIVPSDTSEMSDALQVQ